MVYCRNGKDEGFKMILAPMAGVTDAAFRHVCIDYGCERAFCEMVSVNALNYKSKKTFALLDKADNEERINVQIFGGDPKLMGAAAGDLADRYGDKLGFMDINMGCPMPKIIKCGYGSALLVDAERAANIVKEVKKVCFGYVSVKMRAGFKGGDVNPREFARRMEDSGVDLISVHGRSAAQLYSGKADWNVIKQVKEAVNIPVVGNGDVFKYSDAIKMKEQTGCDDVLVARGAMGNPFIFAKKDNVSILERIDTAIKHLKLCSYYKEEKLAVLQMRKHIAWYIKDQRGSSMVRTSINSARTKDEILSILLKYKEENENIIDFHYIKNDIG